MPEMKCPRAAIFDLDNTLAESFTPLSVETARGLSRLLGTLPLAIMSGASFERMQRYVLPTLPSETKLGRLYLFPDTCARCFVWNDRGWVETYNSTFTSEQYDRAIRALADGMEKTGIVKDAPEWGDRVLARDSQITFAGLGVDAPADKKVVWDPDRVKRTELKAFLDPLLPDLDIRISSRTAIDITKRGVDKASGVRWLAEKLGLEPREMLFVGDDLKDGGNDAMVVPTGIRTRQVSGPSETAEVIEELIRACNV